MKIDESADYSRKETTLMISSLLSSGLVLIISLLVLILDGVVLLAWGKYLLSINRIIFELVVAVIALIATIVNYKVVSFDYGRIKGKKNIIYFIVYNVAITFTLILAPLAILSLIMLILEKKKKRSD